jgi:hypothetical protein
MTNTGHMTHSFVFDYVYDQSCSQKKVYETSARTGVDSALQGYNATIFACTRIFCLLFSALHSISSMHLSLLSSLACRAQTVKLALGRPTRWRASTARTRVLRQEASSHEPSNKSSATSNGTSAPGCAFLSVPHICRSTTSRSSPIPPPSLSLTILPLPLLQISDLLKSDRANLSIREDKKKGVFVEGLSEWVVRSPAEIYGLMERGGAIRATGETKMNEMSSRSHAVFIVIVEQSETIYVDDHGNEVQPSTLSFSLIECGRCQLMTSTR